MDKIEIDTNEPTKAEIISTLAEEIRKSSIKDLNIDENVERGNWSGRFDFLLSCIGFAVGLGNIWRFPYLCYKNGGGAFLVPYFLFLFCLGIPVFLLDLSLGQFTSRGPSKCWEFAPIFTGLGYCMTFLSFIICLYYNIIIAYAVLYFFLSMSYPLPWEKCNNSWNTPACSLNYPPIFKNCSSPVVSYDNGTCYQNSTFVGIWNETAYSITTKIVKSLPAEEYFHYQILNDSGDINNFGLPQWKIVLSLILAWFIVFLCMIKGIKSSGKVVYFTALFPYVVLLILLIRGALLENSIEGVKFYIVPDFKQLISPSIWKDAAGQVFFSLSTSIGGLISLSSYNRFHNHVIKDAFIVCITESLTSVVAGFAIFSYIGYLAGSIKVPVKDVTKSGFGLVFVIYPEALKLLPGSTFWAIIFFFMIITLGLDSQFTMIETVTTSINDLFPVLRRKKMYVMLGICVIGFFLGLPFTCRGGLHLLTVVDNYTSSWTILLVGIFECIVIGWVYGRPGLNNVMRFGLDIELMIKTEIWYFWRIMWQWVSPILIAIIILCNWVTNERTSYSSGKPFPIWADMLGWLISFAALILIFGTGAYKVYKLKNKSPELTVQQCIIQLTKPSMWWGPALPKHRHLMVPYLQERNEINDFYLDPSNDILYTDVFPLIQDIQNDATKID